MSANFKKRIRFFFILFNLIVILLYLLVCLVPFLDPGKYWFIAMLGLLYPFLLLNVILFLIILLLIKSKWVILSLTALLVSWQQLTVVFAVRAEKDFTIDKNFA